MPLVNLRTNLTSLRYGKDTIGGGNSGQPYIKTPIPSGFSGLGNTGGPDFLLRGGSLIPRLIVQDVSRLTKMFFNTKSASGILFTVKQNLLSLSNVNSGAGYVPFVVNNRSTEGRSAVGRLLGNIGNFVRNNVKINQGIYTPLGTIAQAAGTPLGIHLNKQGLNPFTKTTPGSEDGNTPLGLPTYLNVIYNGSNGNKSRLFGLIDKIDTDVDGKPELYTYIGGPGATLGVGKTVINMSPDQRTGINGKNFKFWVNQQKSKNQLVERNQIFVGKDGFTYAPFGVSFISPQLIYGNVDAILAQQFFREDYVDFRSPSVYQAGTLLKTDISKLSSGIGNATPPQVFTQEQIEEYNPSSKTNGQGLVYKESFTSLMFPNGSDNIPISPSYVNNNIEKRVNLGDPGFKGNIRSYSVGKRKLGSTDNNTVADNAGYKNALDKINALPLYKSNNVTSDPVKNDLVKFRIGVIDNTNPSKKTFIHFRGFIDSFGDDYSADWKSQNFMGRGEKFYKYGGFDRKISLSWTVAAQSKQELIPMHQKLNYLASVCAPDYSGAGYMQGNLISLTIGGYLYEQIGIMTGLSLSVPENSPWEIGIPDKFLEDRDINSDPSVKELPMIIKVSGFNFIPIHSFVPRIQQNTFNGPSTDTTTGGKFISAYGKEHYINLANAGGYNNYGTPNGEIQNDNINYTPLN